VTPFKKGVSKLVMNGRLLLDTNIVIALIGNDAAVVRVIRELQRQSLYQ